MHLPDVEAEVEAAHRSSMLRQAGRHEKRGGKWEDGRQLREGNCPVLPYFILNDHLTSRCSLSSQINPKVMVDC